MRVRRFAPGRGASFRLSANREGQRAAALLQRRDANGNILPGNGKLYEDRLSGISLG